MKIKIEIDRAGFKDIRLYLVRHEEDIALEINDFGDLKGLFNAVFHEPAQFDDKAKKEGNQHLEDQS